MQSKVLPFIEFNITQKCNYQCEYCSQTYLNKKEPEKLIHASDEVIDGFIDLLKEIGPEFEINLIGGEPFCHPKFIETAARISNLGNKINVITNMSFPISSFKNLILAAGDNLNLINGSIHVSQIKDLDENIDRIVKIKSLLEEYSPQARIRIVSVVTEENFQTLKYVESRLVQYNIEYVYLRCITDKGSRITCYSDEVEAYLKQREHKYNLDMMRSRSVDTSKILCWAGCKLFHVITDGRIMRCWAAQEKNKSLQCFGNVKDKESIKLLEGPMPCFALACRCNYPAARNAFFEVGDIACHKTT